jgi:hypothetical protein
LPRYLLQARSRFFSHIFTCDNSRTRPRTAPAPPEAKLQAAFPTGCSLTVVASLMLGFGFRGTAQCVAYHGLKSVTLNRFC